MILPDFVQILLRKQTIPCEVTTKRATPLTIQRTATVAAALFAVCQAVSAQADDRKVSEDAIFHYSVMDAMRNGVYRGDLSVKDLPKVGNVGLGTFNNLDGELIGLDGTFYRIAPDGRVHEAEPDRKIPFGSFAFFREDTRSELKVTGDFDAFQKQLLAALPEPNQLYAIRITGTFPEIKVGGANKISDSDRTALADLMKGRPIYTGKDIKGTIVGFYSPPYIGGIDLSPFHLHFISDDKAVGGHVVGMTLTGAALDLALDAKAGMTIELPREQADFNRSWSSSSGTSQKGY